MTYLSKYIGVKPLSINIIDLRHISLLVSNVLFKYVDMPYYNKRKYAYVRCEKY